MKNIPKRKVDMYFDKYSENHQNPTNKTIHWICVPLIFFSIMGLIWSIPFPEIKFLGKNQMYVNWFSFAMAVVIYYYYKLSPVLSYFMLILMCVFSFFIVSIEQLQKNGGPALWLVCSIIFVVAWIGQFIGHKIEGKKPSFFEDVKFLLIGPIWLLHFICKKTGLRY
ncbi:MAG: DUF962 domain-containing protein [Sphingobacteriaceae bacterium]|nr:DUF962 domain-containing protein [Sphingobacteriaceae bacterium]